MKELSNFTLKEFERYKDIVSETEVDIYDLLTVFGYDLDDMDVSDLRKAQMIVNSQSVNVLPIEKVYKVSNRRFKPNLNLMTMTAGQFIDFQTSMTDFKIEDVLSIFLIPQHKDRFGFWRDSKYNSGYDANENKEFIYNNFKIADAFALTNFFFQQSRTLLKTMSAYSEKSLLKKKLKLLENQIEVK